MVQYNATPENLKPALQSYTSGSQLGDQLSQGFSSGIQQGFQKSLENYYEQKKAGQQRALNANAASTLSQQLGLKGDKAKSFVQLMSNIPAEKQPAAFQKLMEAQMYQNYAQGQEGENTPEIGNQFEPEQQGMGLGEQAIPQGQMSPLQQEENALNPNQPQMLIPQGRQQQQQIQPKIKLGGFEFGNNELPKKEKRIPPFGTMAKSAEIQDKRLRDNKKEINEYAKKYEDNSELEKNHSKLLEAQRLIEKEDIDVSTLRKAVIAILEGEDSPIAEMLRTPGQQKIFYLLKDALKTKDIGGSNPSTKEVLISMSAIPSYLKSKEANRYIIGRMLGESEQNLKKGKLIRNLKKYNPEMEPSVFKDIVESKLSKEKEQLENRPSLEEIFQ